MKKLFLVMTGVNTGKLDKDDIKIVALSNEQAAIEMADKSSDTWVQTAELDPDNIDAMLYDDVEWRAFFEQNGRLIRVEPTSSPFSETARPQGYEIDPPSVVKYVITLYAPNRKKAEENAPGVLAYWLKGYREKLEKDGYSLLVEVDDKG